MIFRRLKPSAYISWASLFHPTRFTATTGDDLLAMPLTKERELEFLKLNNTPELSKACRKHSHVVLVARTALATPHAQGPSRAVVITGIARDGEYGVVRLDHDMERLDGPPTRVCLIAARPRDNDDFTIQDAHVCLSIALMNGTILYANPAINQTLKRMQATHTGGRE